MADNPCKNIKKGGKSEACEMYKKRRAGMTIILIIGGILLLFAPFFFYIVLNWVLPVFGVIMIVLAALIGLGIVNVDKMSGYSSGK